MTNYVLPDEIRTPEIGGLTYARLADGLYYGVRGSTRGPFALESLVKDSWTCQYVYFTKPTDDTTNLVSVTDGEGDVWGMHRDGSSLSLPDGSTWELDDSDGLQTLADDYGIREYVYSEPVEDGAVLREPKPGDRVRVTFEGTYSRLHGTNGLHWVDRGDGNALVPAGSVTVIAPKEPEIPADPEADVIEVCGDDAYRIRWGHWVVNDVSMYYDDSGASLRWVELVAASRRRGSRLFLAPTGLGEEITVADNG